MPRRFINGLGGPLVQLTCANSPWRIGTELGYDGAGDMK